MNELSYKRHGMMDLKWETIKEYLPGQEGKSGRTAKGNKSFMNQVFWITRKDHCGEIYLRIIGNGIRYTKDLFGGQKIERGSIYLKF